MYWVVLSCFSLAESWSWFILSWSALFSDPLPLTRIDRERKDRLRKLHVNQITNQRDTCDRLPFYAYFRLLLLSYLVLPQTQGARLLYQSHIDPFLAHYEADIDNFITNAHDRAKAFGLSSLKRAIEFFKENVLGMPPRSSSSASSNAYGTSTGTYAQNLLSRFNLPSARRGLVSPTAAAAGDFYGLLSAALGQMSAGPGGEVSREAQVEEMSRSGALVPPELTSTAEKMSFVATQRERLKVLLTALDKQADELSQDEMIERDVETRLRAAGAAALPSTDEGLRKSKSEAEFEAIEREEWGSERTTTERGEHQIPPANSRSATSAGGSWIPWGIWGAQKSGT